jgi:hypothetical protein
MRDQEKCKVVFLYLYSHCLSYIFNEFKIVSVIISNYKIVDIDTIILILLYTKQKMCQLIHKKYKT